MISSPDVQAPNAKRCVQDATSTDDLQGGKRTTKFRGEETVEVVDITTVGGVISHDDKRINTRSLNAFMEALLHVPGDQPCEALYYFCSCHAQQIVDSKAWYNLARGLQSPDLIIQERSMRALSSLVTHSTGQFDSIVLCVRQHLIRSMERKESASLCESCLLLIVKLLENEPIPTSTILEWTPFLFGAIIELDPSYSGAFEIVFLAVCAVRDIILHNKEVHIEETVFKRLIEFSALHPSSILMEPALDAIGSLARDSPELIGIAIDAGAVGNIVKILNDASATEQAKLNKEIACELFGTLTTGTSHQFDLVFKPSRNQTLKKLCNLVMRGNEVTAVQQTALLVVLEFIGRCQDNHLEWLCFEVRILAVLCDVITFDMEVDLLVTILIAIQRALQVCHKYDIILHQFQDAWVRRFNLCELTFHPNTNVATISEDIVERYYYENQEWGEQENVQPVGKIEKGEAETNSIAVTNHSSFGQINSGATNNNH